jgi:rod shape-determining protein MreD
VKRKGERRRPLVLALIAAVLLTLVPLPESLDVLRPYWVALVVIYWALEVQGSINMGLAFLVGLLLDILTGSLLGMHALSLVVIIYLVERFRARIRFFPPWQQALAILALLVNDRIIVLWIGTLLGEPVPTWHYWLPPVVGTLIWPWLFIVLDRARVGQRSPVA